MPSDQLLNADGIRILKQYIAIQFWRLPLLDEFADQYLRARTLAEIEHYCTVSNPPMPSQKVFELIQSDAGARHYFRSFILPLVTFNLNHPIPDAMKWIILDVENPNEWSNHLCSDAPFIFFDNPENLMEFSGPFIFPLSNSKLLVSKPRSNTTLSFDPAMSTRIWLVREISGLFPPLFAPQKKSCRLQKRTCSSEPAKQAYPQAVASAPLSLAGDRLWVSRVINTI